MSDAILDVKDRSLSVFSNRFPHFEFYPLARLRNGRARQYWADDKELPANKSLYHSLLWSGISCSRSSRIFSSSSLLINFYAAEEEAVTGRGVKGEVSAAIRQRTSEILALLKEDVIEATPEGWWVPSQRARSYTLPNSDVWLYDAFSPEAARGETLHPMIARAIVDKYSPPRGRIVDPMAGSGVIARAALELERWVWPSDAKPRHPRVHERDAFTLHREPQPGIGEAHLVVIHPPSFALWSQQKVEGTGGLSNNFMLILQDSYADFLSGLVEATLPLATLRGNLVVVLRPARITPYEVDSIFPFTAVFGALRDKAVAIAYHVAAARDGSEDWHILVFNNRSRSST